MAPASKLITVVEAFTTKGMNPVKYRSAKEVEKRTSSQPIKPHRNSRTGRTNVKSGCRTCKIRKVKCDEGRPACRRCVSTGRGCDGYGLWGGGGNFYGQRQNSYVTKHHSHSVVAPWLPQCVSILTDSSEERRCFEWFMIRTAKKLPGIFASISCEMLLLQASLKEPAVLHAVLTLGSVHKGGISNNIGHDRSDETPNEQEQFMLQHYTKAIQHLQPLFLTEDRGCVRVALITCVVFIWLEFLRGHFKTAVTHLESGLKVLQKMETSCSVIDDNNSYKDGRTLRLKPSRDSTEDWIGQAFSRLHILLELFKPNNQYKYFINPACELDSPICVFHSINEAWQQMEWLLRRIFHLTGRGRQYQASKGMSTDYPNSLFVEQQRIQAELARWPKTFEASRKLLESQETEELAIVASHLLRTYLAMATVMADTCLCSDDESVYDAYTEQFVLLLHKSAVLGKMRALDSRARALPGHCTDMSRSIVDIGWIPPLYYAAIKCRVHRVRIQAIRLLESTSHREGIWDSRIAAGVARKVMEIEEKDFYRDDNTVDDFPLFSSPEWQDLALPSLPQSYRVPEANVLLCDGPSVFLECKQRQMSGGWEVLRKEYNVLSQCWVDGQIDEEGKT